MKLAKGLDPVTSGQSCPDPRSVPRGSPGEQKPIYSVFRGISVVEAIIPKGKGLAAGKRVPNSKRTSKDSADDSKGKSANNR